ncbi:N-acetylglucosamine kinase [Lachnoclostridium phytofermentans]|uniref:N-acetylglucosamine kinase n=1 Tax=Lachnoclostridium phytofermentans TaxID=66219 RepID=UPI001F602616|nr:BadF/BadG/BcrA/BcrD ATPase family protein [Lachnoclostridium phytofermentans]
MVGWDGGGTKTSMKVLDLDGNTVLCANAGSLNYNSNPKEEIRKTINTLIAKLLNLTGELSDCKGMCISAAGISNREASSFLTSSLEQSGIRCEINIVGDHEAALYGAFGKPEGIILISGTGSICFGMNQSGQKIRTGGYGHLIDDEGSGYAIGRDILSTAVQIYDKRITNSNILDLVYETLGVHSVEEIIQYTYQSNWNKACIASLSPVILKALKRNDPHARAICEKASNELVRLVIPVAKMLTLEQGKMALLGGILTHYEPIKNMVVKKLADELPALNIVEPMYDSATGAAIIARHNYLKEYIGGSFHG